MSGLAALLAGHTPPRIYQWHNAASVEDVQHAVEKAGWCFRYLDGWTVEDKESFLKTTAASLDLPDYFGQNLDALADSLDDIDCGEHGMVLLWDGWSPLARHDEKAFAKVKRILEKRAASDKRGKLAVIMRGEGPSIEVEELPIKH